MYMKKLPEDFLARLHMRFYSRLKKEDFRTEIFLPLPNQKKKKVLNTNSNAENKRNCATDSARVSIIMVHNEFFFGFFNFGSTFLWENKQMHICLEFLLEAPCYRW